MTSTISAPPQDLAPPDLPAHDRSRRSQLWSLLSRSEVRWAALLSTIANAGRHGVLVKSAVALEKFGKTDLVALDKTGTLTEGTTLRVSEIELVPAAGLTTDQLPALAAAAERPSEQPLARAVLTAAHERGIPVPHSEDFASTPIVWILPLQLGVAGHEGSAVVVSLNGLRLLARAAWQQADQAVGRASVVPERQAA